MWMFAGAWLSVFCPSFCWCCWNVWLPRSVQCFWQAYY